MVFQTFYDIKNYVEQYTENEILYKALQEFYHEEDVPNVKASFEELKARFDSDTARETTPNISYFQEQIEDIKRNITQYEDVYTNYLNDEISRSIFCFLIAAKISLDVDYLKKAYMPSEIRYFSPTLFDLDGDEVYVDCGGYIGDSIISFIQQVPHYKAIYVYEASPEIMKESKKNLSDFSRDGSIIFREAAVFSEQTQLHFSMKNGNGDSCIDDNGVITVSAVSLDEDISEPISFIKMDIEGSEIDALLGAKEHIANETPKMAICIYHKKNDFWKIPQLIRSINPQYTFAIRHHQAYQYYDTVLYCIPPRNSQTYNAKIHTVPYDTVARRCRTLLSKLQSYSEEDLVDIDQTFSSKIWCLRTMRCREQEIGRLNNRIQELVESIHDLECGKTYLEGQVLNQSDVIAELKDWCAQLENAKTYLEDQIANRDVVVEDYKALVEQLTIEKNSIHEQLGDTENLVKKLKFYLHEEINRPWYKKIFRKTVQSEYIEDEGE